MMVIIGWLFTGILACLKLTKTADISWWVVAAPAGVVELLSLMMLVA